MFTEQSGSGAPAQASQTLTGRKESKGRQIAGLQKTPLRLSVPCLAASSKSTNPLSVLVQPYQVWPGTALSQRTPEMIFSISPALYSLALPFGPVRNAPARRTLLFDDLSNILCHMSDL